MDAQKIKEMIAKEIQKYEDDKTSFKPYMQSMKEMGSWLATKEKK